jgi:hypothetical protein
VPAGAAQITRRAILAALAGVVAGASALIWVGRRHRNGLSAGRHPPNVERATQTPTPTEAATLETVPTRIPTKPELAATPSRGPFVAGAAARVEIVAGSLALQVYGQPFLLQAAVDGVLVLDTPDGIPQDTPYGTLAYRRAGSDSWHHVTDLAGVEAVPDGKRLVAATTEPDVGPSIIDVVVHSPDVLRLSFRPPPGQPVASVSVAVAHDDPRAWREEQQYLLGPDLLVAPVVQPGARDRSVYLPQGDWRDWWTGMQHTGKSDVTVPAPADRIPVFVRAGVPAPLPGPEHFAD